MDFTVSRMYDEHFNVQSSPINWSAFVSKQELEWFTVDQTKEIQEVLLKSQKKKPWNS